MDNQSNEIFKIPARCCSVCGGLLTSDKSIREGCGPACKLKRKRAAEAHEAAENQCSLFDMEYIEEIKNESSQD